MAKRNVNYEKKYYETLKKKFEAVSANDEFYAEIDNAIKSGKRVVSQKRIKESQVFDATWVETIEQHLNHIDNIVRSPRMFMEAQEDVVRIERAKKINARTVAHLSSHTENVQTIRNDGVIVPKKLLSVTYEDKLAIYENRFVMTLIQKLAAFIEIRYEAIQENIKTYQSDKLTVNSKFNWRNYDVDCNIDIKVTENIDDDLNRKNQELIQRINNLRMYTRGFVNSEFFKTLRATSTPVSAPILRTNIILKSVDYNSCLQLWLFMDSYRQLGFNVDVAEKNLDFDEAYENDLVNMIIYNYSAMVTNQEDRSESYHLKPYKFKKIKDQKEDALLITSELPSGKEEMEAPSVNEYFYQRTKDSMSDEYENLIKSGKSYNQSLTTVYKRLQAITNSVYKDLFEKLKPELSETATYSERKKAKFMYTKRKLSVMKSIAWLKEMEAINAKRELEKLEADMEKYKKLEQAYQEELKKQRKEQLAKAREARRNMPKTEEELKLLEERKQKRLMALQAARDKLKFEKEKRLAEEEELRQIQQKALEEERLQAEREIKQELDAEKLLAKIRVDQEEAEKYDAMRDAALEKERLLQEEIARLESAQIEEEVKNQEPSNNELSDMITSSDIDDEGKDENDDEEVIQLAPSEDKYEDEVVTSILNERKGKSKKRKSRYVIYRRVK